MKILFAGHKERGVRCLRALVTAGHEIVHVLVHPEGRTTSPDHDVAAAAWELGLPVLQPARVDEARVMALLQARHPALIVLAGYGPIVGPDLLRLAPNGCLNLHGGKLPQYRGSSPMNWALINGETSLTISIVAADTGVDTGDVLLERTFPIGMDDTIADLHRIANAAFPELLLEAIRQIQAGTAKPRKQDQALAAYYPLRFPDDGLLMWDLCTAVQIHNRIRALTDPYPGAFTFLKGRRVRLLRSALAKSTYHGEPGRVYLKSRRGLLVCALDRCLWIQRAIFEDGGTDAVETIERYDKFATVRDVAAAHAMTDSWK